jgi:hypothetical protein
MGNALTAAGKKVPKYLQTVAATGKTELPTDHATAAFAMSCFWTGEYELGNIDGVVQTEAGFLDGREVTLVEFDESQVSLESLAKQAAQVRCAQKVFTAEGEGVAGLAGGKLDRSYRPAPVADQKKQLANWTNLARVPGLNEMQKTKLNALAPRDMQQAMQWLSPRQRKVFAEVVKH